MKKLLIAVLALSLTSCYTRIGRLTVASTRNIGNHTDYVLIAKDVTGKAKTKKQDALEIAIDKAVKDYPTGEFMENVIVSVSHSGRKIRVHGDVWGTAPTTEKK
jgi:uncharacterized protein YxeA